MRVHRLQEMGAVLLKELVVFQGFQGDPRGKPQQSPMKRNTHMGVAQNQTRGVTQVLARVPFWYQFFEPPS